NTPVFLKTSEGQRELGGVLLEPVGDGLAVSALKNFSSSIPDDLAIIGDLTGVPVLLTQATIKLETDATVEQVNALLDSTGARIVRMTEDSLRVVVRFNNDSVDRLIQLIDALSGSRAVSEVLPDVIHDLAIIPDPYALLPNSVAHQVAVGGHALLNAQAA